MKNAIIDEPTHYIKGRKYEPIDVILDWQLDQYHFRACALKYIARAGRKEDEICDLHKSIWYLQKEVERLEEEQSANENRK